MNAVVIMGAVLIPAFAILSLCVWKPRGAATLKIVDVLSLISLAILPLSLLSFAFYSHHDPNRSIPIVVVSADTIPFVAALFRLALSNPKAVQNLNKHLLLFSIIVVVGITAFQQVIGFIDRAHNP